MGICAPDIQGGASQGRVCHVKGCKRLSITSSLSESSAFRETDDNPYRANANARPTSQISFLRVTRSLLLNPFEQNWVPCHPRNAQHKIICHKIVFRKYLSMYVPADQCLNIHLS